MASTAAKELGHKITKQFQTMGLSVKLMKKVESPRFTTYYYDMKDPLQILKLKEKHIDVIRDFNKVSIIYGKPEGYSFSLTVQKKRIKTLRVTALKQPISPGRRIKVNIGLDLLNRDVVIDFDKTNHILVAGTTGSGKSALINTLLYTLIKNVSQDEYELKLIDPKRVSFNAFKSLKNAELITEIDQATDMLDQLIILMESRYKFMETNNETDKNIFKPTFVVVDELAELMLVDRANCEEKLIRLLQKGRQANIHIILATQRPTTDVISGLIKAQCDTRICLKMASAKDSVTVIDKGIGQSLLGCGDGFIKYPDRPTEIRFQGALVKDEEIAKQISSMELKKSILEPQVHETYAVTASGVMPMKVPGGTINIANERVRAAVTKCMLNMKTWGFKLPANLVWTEESSRAWLGLTKFTHPCIILNEKLYQQTDPMIDIVIYHELGHLIAGAAAGHSGRWKEVMNEIHEHTGYVFREYVYAKIL